MMEPVAEITASLRRDMEASPVSGLTFLSRPQLEIIEASLVRLSDAEARIAELEAENAALAAHACVFLDGSGVTGDEHGNSVCMLSRRLEAAEALLKEAGKALEPFVAEADKWAKENAQVHFADDDAIALHIKGNVCGFCGEEPGCDVAAFNVGHLRAARAIHDKIGVKDE